VWWVVARVGLSRAGRVCEGWWDSAWTGGEEGSKGALAMSIYEDDEGSKGDPESLVVPDWKAEGGGGDGMSVGKGAVKVEVSNQVRLIEEERLGSLESAASCIVC
jgi:hypothetical protein